MDTYYQMLDRDSTTVNPTWKGMHIFSLGIAILSGFTAAYMVGRSIEMFGTHCILFANISFFSKNETIDPSTNFYGLHPVPRHLKQIDVANCNWGSHHLCYFCQFVPVVSMIVGIIWCGFFVMCSRGGAGFIGNEIYRPWRIVYPAMFSAVIITTTVLLSTIQLSDGVDYFCNQFNNIFNSTGCVDGINDYTLSFGVNRTNITMRLQVAIILSYICFGAWLVHLVSLVLRVICLTDFQMIKITVIDRDDVEDYAEVYDSDSETPETPKAPLASIPEIGNDNMSPSSTNHTKPTHGGKRVSILDTKDEIQPPNQKSFFQFPNHNSPELNNKTKIDPAVVQPPGNRIFNSKQNFDQRPVSFDSTPPEGVREFSADSGENKINNENILLSTLNERVDNFNKDSNSNQTVFPDARETTLYHV